MPSLASAQHRKLVSGVCQICLAAVRALSEFAIQGIKTTLPLHRRILDSPEFEAGDYTIHWLERFVAGGASVS